MIEDARCDVWYARLKDKISDMGIIGVVIVRYHESVAEIDTFLLSCRVLSRGIELALLTYIIESARLRGCQVIKGSYIPNGKNGQVEDFYRKNGFTASTTDGTGATYWTADLSVIKMVQPSWLHVIQEARK